MKKYIEPQTVIVTLHTDMSLLGASKVSNGGQPGDDYNNTDVTYSRQNEPWRSRQPNVWDDGEEEEQ